MNKFIVLLMGFFLIACTQQEQPSSFKSTLDRMAYGQSIAFDSCQYSFFLDILQGAKEKEYETNDDVRVYLGNDVFVLKHIRNGYDKLLGEDYSICINTLPDSLCSGKFTIKKNRGKVERVLFPVIVIESGLKSDNVTVKLLTITWLICCAVLIAGILFALFKGITKKIKKENNV